jgi:signal transduction histidine kinase/ligand-binding sensor domain-containing protein/CheY-like chemotaxis protein
MKITLLVFTALYAFFGTVAQTEKIVFKNLTTSMGLSHGDVTCINQDQDGYLWFGTANGLNRYNGIEFSVYNFNNNDTTSISNNYIISIYVDKQNNVWIGSKGLCRYNRDKNNFERIPIIDDQNNLLNNNVTAICEDKQNRLWIGTNYGVYLFDSKTKRFIPYYIDNNRKEKLANCSGIVCDKNGILWISSNDSKAGGLIRYDPERKISTFYNTQHPILKLKEVSVSCLSVDNNNNIWIGYVTEGIDVFNQKTHTITSYQNDPKNENSLNNNTIFSITQNTDGKIFIGTNRGLNILDTKTTIFNHYITSESNVSLLSNTIQNIFIGSEGTIWIACWAGGVSMFDKRFGKFTLYQHIKQDVNALSGNSVTCFTEDVNRNIWIATDGGGINCFNPTEKKFISYQTDSKYTQSLTNNKVLAIASDAHGDLWAGMWAGGLNCFKINKSQLILKRKYQYVDENNPASTSVFNFYVNKNGQLWVGNFGTGAYFLGTNTYKFTPFPIKDSTNKPLSFVTVRDILCDYRNDIWFGTQESGLIRYNPTTENYEQFVHKEGDSTTLLSNSINIIFEDSKKRLWIGLDEGGLNVFDRKSKKFIHFTTDQGLPNNSIVGILEDNKGNLWISSFNGISKAIIDSTKGTLKLSFRNYTVQDGLQDKVFNRWSYFKSHSGEMYFGGLNGFNVFNPDSIKDNGYKPPVHFTDFLLFNKPVIIGAKGSPLNKHISQTKKLALNYDQSIFTFRFIALNYIFSEKNQYAYMMEGFEKDWNYVGNKREATYTNLDPGEYTFRVKASNNDGIWNEEGTSINIIILPPWWKTRVALVSFVLLIIFLFLGFYFFRINQLQNQKKMLEKLVKERTHEIEEKNRKLNKQKKELNEQNELLEERQQQIIKQNEMLFDQTEKLNNTNTLLKGRQEEITLQNEELENHRNHLEHLVEERTSELVRAKIKAEESDRLKSSFLANMSHEIRTPMNAIYGFSGLLKNVSLSKEKKSEFIDIINDNCESLLILINDILDISRIEADQLVFKNEKYNVDDILINLEKIYKLNKGKKISIEFINNTSKNGLVLNNDKVRFRQIFINLLNNAYKFTDSGHIKFGYEVFENNARFFVSDTGIGVESSETDKIFNHFYKIENNPLKLYRGAGLGLAICKKLVEMMGGEIWVESVINQGSVFYFTLPYNKDISPSQRKEKKEEQKKLNLKNFTILVAEDTSTNYELIYNLLKPFCAEISWAQNGQEAINFIKNNPDIKNCIILMDIKMPFVDGYEAHTKIKAINDKIPVIAITAYAQVGDKERILNDKFDDYISKPVKIETLLAALLKYSLP